MATPAATPTPSRGLPILLSLNAGYVDAASFLALHGLFTAHVTGNFVTLGAALVTGSSGVLAKLLALPVFCAVIFALRASRRLQPGLRGMLGWQAALLVLAALLIWRLVPGRDGDDPSELLAGMVLVAAMAVQNAASRIHLATAPPTTMMTGITTQVMIDLADLAAQRLDAAAAGRLRSMGTNLLAFAVGCGAGALLFHFAGAAACFAVPPLLILGAMVLAA